ncbi:unnamed protein product [Phytomonas sp. Hart1]|nr:unnamed protein product [Phytomonas sp. Hart1]|eukprot:CCW66027.1 unnamed protein product [Phytomonas sp. isolate Hart1]
MSHTPVLSPSHSSTRKDPAQREKGETKSFILTQPSKKAWTCPQCGRTSLDIRHVCGNCLGMEFRTNKGMRTTDFQQLGNVDLRPPDHINDPQVRLYKIPNTHRVYRQFVEPIRVDTDNKTKSSSDSHPDISEKEDSSTEINLDECTKEICYDRYDNEDETQKEFVSPTKQGAIISGSKKARSSNQSKKKSANFTHFISLPIGKLPAVRPLAEAFLQTLRDFLEKECGTNEISISKESATKKMKSYGKFHVQNPRPQNVTNVDKMHITLLMLSLKTEKDVEFAKSLLHVFAERWVSFQKLELKEEMPHDFKKTDGLRVTLGGLQVMPNRQNCSSDPRRSSVVYMELYHTARLRQLQDILFETFAELITDQNEADHCKLHHITIINQKWSLDQKYRFFDATKVLKRFGSASIAGIETNEDGIQQHDVWVDRLELNRRFASTSENQYHVEDFVTL